MTLQQKKNIDILAPVLLATGIGFWFFQRKGKDWKALLAVIAVVFLVSYLITTKITRSIYEKAPPIALPNDVSLQECGNFDPAPICNAIKDDAYSIISIRDSKPYEQLAALSNCELTQCYKYWRNNMFSINSETLPQAIAAEAATWNFSFRAVQKVLADSFASLNLQ